MSATGEVENPTVDQTVVDVPTVEMVEEQPQAAERTVKEKKTRTPREKKPKPAKTTASHPPYFQMIKEALLALNEKGGSSPYAVAKYMEDKHKGELPANFKKMLGLQLKNSAAKGKLIKIKASYKLSEAGKKENTISVNNKKPAKPKSEMKKTRQTRSATAVKPKMEAKTKTKKVEKTPQKKKMKKAKKSAPAKPKSIKSSGAKKAKKVAA